MKLIINYKLELFYLTFICEYIHTFHFLLVTLLISLYLSLSFFTYGTYLYIVCTDIGHESIILTTLINIKFALPHLNFINDVSQKSFEYIGVRLNVYKILNSYQLFIYYQ